MSELWPAEEGKRVRRVHSQTAGVACYCCKSAGQSTVLHGQDFGWDGLGDGDGGQGDAYEDTAADYFVHGCCFRRDDCAYEGYQRGYGSQPFSVEDI